MPDDYSAPLVLGRPRRALPIWPFLAGPTVVILLGLAAWAALKGDPYGGQPHVTVDLPPLPPAEPDDQIIIRDP